MTKLDTKQNRAILRSLPGVFRTRDLESQGFPRTRLAPLVRDGQVQRMARGVYRVQDDEASEYETIAAVSARIPRGVICLYTALAVHEIGTQLPPKVWIAVDRKARKPRTEDLPVRIVRFSGRMLTYAVETRKILGVPVRITSPARTVVDCFRYRHKYGIDVALEALRDVFQSRIATIHDIHRVAEACRTGTVIGPYMEMLAS